jgi:hypothetical protein
MPGLTSSPLDGGHDLSTEQSIAEHQQFHNRALLPVVIIFLVLSNSSIALRLWTRAHFLKRLGWDDYIIIAAAVRVNLTVKKLQKLMRRQIFFSIYCSTVLTMFILAENAKGITDIPVTHVEEVVSVSIAHSRIMRRSTT